MCNCVETRSVWDQERKPKARKIHKCEECKQDIERGSYYYYFCGVAIDYNRGETGRFFWKAKICLECCDDWNELDRRFSEANTELCICYGELSDTIDRAINEAVIEEDDPLAEKWFGTVEEQQKTWAYLDPRQLLLPYERVSGP